MEMIVAEIKKTVLYSRMVFRESERNSKAWAKIMKAILSLSVTSLVLIWLIFVAFTMEFPEGVTKLVEDFASQLRVGLTFLVLSLVATVLAFPLIFIWQAAKIHDEQEKRIKRFAPENLDIRVYDTYIHHIFDENKNEMVAVVLEAKNGDMKRKIVELETEIVFMQQSSIDPDDGEITVLFNPSQLVVWQSGATRIDLRPDACEAFCLCYFASRPLGAPLRVHFGVGEFTNHLFERESIYQMNIKFTGKYEDETEFRQCQIMQTIYSKPQTKELMTGNLAMQMQLLEIPEILFRVLEAAKTGGWMDYSSPFRRQQEQKKKVS